MSEGHHHEAHHGSESAFSFIVDGLKSSTLEVLKVVGVGAGVALFAAPVLAAAGIVIPSYMGVQMGILAGGYYAGKKMEPSTGSKKDHGHHKDHAHGHAERH